MNVKAGTLHFHIGVDNVFESSFENVVSLPPVGTNPVQITYIPEEFYKANFRNAVDMGQKVVLKETIGNFRTGTKDTATSAEALALSRPRFLNVGSPMNMEGGAVKAVYKLESFQSVFSEIKIIFHVFITDHLTYLFGLSKASNSLPACSSVSWVPLVECIRSVLEDGNELKVHNAEALGPFHKSLIMDLLRHDKKTASAIYQKHLSPVDRPVPPSEVEARASAAGWDVEMLDDCFAQDLSILFNAS
ncbi:MAG: hypothetical protein ABJH45_21230 [Paracoccaceae bacterium]|uniref:hypothetical protein n=1 Tax=Roseibium sp. TaxID=1936156 RepID=UPI0032868DC4